MPHTILLLAVALAGWLTGQIIDREGLGTTGDVLFGIAGGLVVRSVMHGSVGGVDLLLFSVWGAAAAAAAVRFWLRPLRVHKSGSAAQHASCEKGIPEPDGFGGSTLRRF